MRILIAGLVHETHTFVPGRTTLADFRVRVGDALWQAEGDASTLDGVLSVAREGGWEVVPAAHYYGGAGAMVTAEAVETWWQQVQTVLERETALDGIFLDLHGAMVSEHLLDVEGEIVRRIRAYSQAPIGGVLDPHGNITRAFTDQTQSLVCYRCNPHTDAHEAAVRGARLLDRIVRRGEHATTVRIQPAIVWPPTGTGSADEPMCSLLAAASVIEASDPEILAVNVFGGFAFADIPETGVCLTAVTVGDPERARVKLESLAQLARQLAPRGVRRALSLETALDNLNPTADRPSLIVEPADNIGGGAPGECTVLLRAFLDRRLSGAGVIINDPVTVAELQAVPIGGRKTVTIGGRTGVAGSDPVTVEVVVASRSDGRFTLEDLHSHMAGGGKHIHMGPTVVARADGVTLLLTSRATPPFDLGQWRSQGIDPETLRVIGVKAAVAHRQAYDPIAGASYTVDTPGPCAENLARLPFQRIRRPIFPLDEIGL